ncbi:MAG: T9SS type A sorting domain-containing protein [Dyadobacter sp.]|uniref:putative type IX secretion system sortase PorU2 n=1 Tax=Dyadobacter sp. TaxID=1914288 RepID=UPI001B100022|nr:C25 family cysteine peptidase [Dyadobacter sp.]MBO9615488.1 T9SS type A sorting domain-containing protein [Dyadobacter sp.]
MSTKKFTTLFFIAASLLIQLNGFAQTPWSGKYGNEWLNGKYGQTWVKIAVSKAGLYKVTLPDAFKNKPNFLHLYHRGEEVTLVSASNTEIEFYGVPNDGSTDELLYRLPTTRKNTYFSTYSDESSYFLTFDSNARPVATSETLSPDQGLPKQGFHKFTFLKKFVIENSHMTSYPTRPATLNSYFEEGKAGTGTRIANNQAVRTTNAKPAVFTNTYVAEPFAFQIKSKYGSNAPEVNVHFKGRGYQFSANPIIETSVGKDAGTLRVVGTTGVTGFLDADYPFTLQDNDYANGAGLLGFRATGAATDGFSVSYYTVTYDQNIDMQTLTSYEFNFPAASGNTRFTILNPPATGTLRLIDVSNTHSPRIINGSAADLMVSRNGGAMKLFAGTEVLTGTPTAVSFQQINPAAFDYLILTADTLLSSANEYATYRQTESPGKKYKPLVTRIKDVYNQFNYGEPSPVAIRRFVDYMVSDSNTDKFLLLLGRSVTYYERSVREIPDEIPTIGFPGSDMLLADGLGGAPDDVPVIPVGRISAITNQQVKDYLQKIRTYEKQKDLAWRKNVVHINGGKTLDEVNAFAKYLSDISGPIFAAPFKGDTIQRKKFPISSATVPTTISADLNGVGAGMVTYFGHGNVDATDFDFGYATDPAKGYANTDRYPVLFYNGCGVNNIYSNRFSPFSGAVPPNYPTSSGKRPLSLDWLLAPNAGAIVVFGNDWDAYASTSNEYLDRLYPKIFGQDDANRGTIGQILRTVALETKTAKGYTYNPAQNARVASYYDADRANVHQVILQGDPALRILINEGPMPVSLVSFDAKAAGSDKVNVTWVTASEKNNSHFVIERSYNAKNFVEIGSVEGKGDSDVATSYEFADRNPLAGTNYYRLKQVDRATTVNGQIVEGEITYSRIVSVTREGTSALVAWPNPTLGKVDLKLNVPTKIKSWDVMDQKGIFYQREGTGTEVNLENLPSGEYIIKISTENDDVYLRKVLKK